jgi:hypothetical protein
MQQQQIPGHGKGLASLILGILAIVCGGPVLGIVGIVLGKQAKSEAQAAGMVNGMANIGFILSIVGVVLGAIWYIVVFGIIGIGVLWEMF